ncbi:MAG TPA: SDR family NAD(P)-dependent oxidoreductase [Burkholderiales bacterium]|jgi:NAD(P)-dependent dehydrogenase (short-subunit alcohol dehydrogenase family)|nr:SDR family NAD(P)-dependent oxidoreductase [Burkholderiales bacterium]
MSDDPVCLVTGGASGIGAACVEAFAAAGYCVLLGDVQAEKGEALAKKLGAKVVFIELDVRVEGDFAQAVAAALERWGRLDCVVNNAAIAGVLGPIAAIPLEEYEHACSIIQRSVFLGMREAARAMQPRRSGSIVNIASISGLAGGYGPHVYSACKAAVVAMTRSVALELAESGIRVNAVCPGNIETPIHTGVTDERWVERMAKIRPTKRDDQAIERMGLPQEIAAAVLWLASDAASYVTGQALAVDGGLTAGLPWRKQPAFMRELHLAKKPDR